MSRAFPDGLEKYAQTPIFTQDTMPEKLASVHDTKVGVWGKLVVVEGALDYIISGPPETCQRINAGEHGVIEPTIWHRVKIIGPVRFLVEFHKSAASAPIKGGPHNG